MFLLRENCFWFSYYTVVQLAMQCRWCNSN